MRVNLRLNVAIKIDVAAVILAVVALLKVVLF